jgi:hypothetical protein
MTDPEQPTAFFDPYAVSLDAEVAIALLADLQIRRAIERGEFDDLPGRGKPLDLSNSHDADWWLKSLMKREGFVMLPLSIQLRKDDALLDAQLDRLSTEKDVRHEIDEFNSRVIRARYELAAGPPLVTMPRDVDQTVRSWAERRAKCAAEARERQRLEDLERDTSRRHRRKRRR